MKSTVSTCVMAVAALLAGTAFAGDSPRADGAGMRADTDGDGRISRAEATAASSERSGKWFDKVDRDNDGYVTQEELKQARDTRSRHRHEKMKSRMDERFKAADSNSDGQISLDEAQAKLPKLAERFSELDGDKDGMLSKDELKRGHSRRAQSQK